MSHGEPCVPIRQDWATLIKLKPEGGEQLILINCGTLFPFEFVHPLTIFRGE